MSYDLIVFEAAVAPRDRKKLLAWFDKESRSDERRGSKTQSDLSSALKTWLDEIVKTFPPMNGSVANDDFDDPTLTDYSLGRSIIHCAFAWSRAEEAYKLVKRLAAKHGVGFFDLSAVESPPGKHSHFEPNTVM